MADFSKMFGSPSLDPSIKTSTTNYEYDPTQEFVNKLIQQSYSAGKGTVSPTVTAGIDQMITQPGAVGDIAGSQFASIAQPLLEQQQAGFKIQNQNTADAFRKAGVGSMQSGAFAQAVRQQAADQGRQQNALLASSYIPLAANLSSNVLGGINAGVKVPGANMDSLAGILSAIGRNPLSTTTTQTGMNEGGAGARTTQLSYPGPSTIEHMPSPVYPEWMGKTYAPTAS